MSEGVWTQPCQTVLKGFHLVKTPFSCKLKWLCDEKESLLASWSCHNFCKISLFHLHHKNSEWDGWRTEPSHHETQGFEPQGRNFRFCGFLIGSHPSLKNIWWNLSVRIWRQGEWEKLSDCFLHKNQLFQTKN